VKKKNVGKFVPFHKNSGMKFAYALLFLYFTFIKHEAKEIQDTTLCIFVLKHCGRVTQICVFYAVKLGTSASSP